VNARVGAGFLAHPAVGTVGVAVTARGVVALTLARTRCDAAAALTARVASGVRPDDEACAPALRQVGEYLAGARRAFDLRIDWALPHTPFQRRVWQALCGVPYGTAVSYGELAALAGRPGAARAVGNAMNQNPIALVIPCHRVIAAGGRIGGYGGGLDIKRALLALEGIHMDAGAPPGGRRACV
jgi:methylated-DNA-[protein]-cysteine S-methyltransferase